MSGSDWGKRSKVIEGLFCLIVVIGAAVLIYVLGQNFGVSAGRDEVTAREHYENAKQNALLSCDERERAAMVQCVTKAIESAQEQSDSRQDLFVQRDMAHSAFWMLILAGSTFGVTALGVWYVRRTLDATLKAVKDTGDATAAMIEANKIAEISQRPWLDFKLTPTRPVSLEYGSLMFPADIEIKNYSNTPATDVKAFWRFFAIGAADVANLIDQLIQEAESNDTFNKTTVFPGTAPYSDDAGASDWCSPFDGAELPTNGLLIFGFVYSSPRSRVMCHVFEAYHAFIWENSWHINRLRPYKRIA